MNVAEIRAKLLTDDSFVLAETKKLQYFYGLKHEIRYDLERPEHDFSESVAEHVYGMAMIADYFLPLEDPDQQLDHTKIKTMITWHDMDELETGDTISWKKTPEDIENEATAWQAVVPHLPTLLKDQVEQAVGEYEALKTSEAKFVKGIDKIEPLFHMYTELGKIWCQEIGMKRNDADRIKLPYLTDFPCMLRFTNVVHNAMEQEGFFSV